MGECFESATPVLKSGDYDCSRRFYAGLLGFEVVEEGGDPPRFGIFRQGRAVLHIDAWNGPPPPSPGGWAVYIHVSGIVEIRQRLMDAGVTIRRDLEDTAYGMREFEITDPDGNVICFGQDAI